ncbi:DUF732 domain-containing protein [Mycolicibacterium sp. lyk4-40-TYG-92]|uniref:DUF732 domain-containing protein n=1 Tax=Mycolicibacterium sp. lyk4-40-TYG-92 TaxID=3040295 RepID=UPI0033063886
MVNTRTHIGALAATAFVGCFLPIIAAHAQPPGFCGAHEDPFVCTARNQTSPPTAGESTFIGVLRGPLGTTEAKLLVAGRTICTQLSAGASGQYVATEVGAYLGIDRRAGGQVLEEAVQDICPGVHVS